MVYKREEEEKRLLAKVARELKQIDIRNWSTYPIDSVSHGYSLAIGDKRVNVFGYCFDIVANPRSSYPIPIYSYPTRNCNIIKRLYDHLEEQWEQWEREQEQGKRRRPTALENSLEALLKLKS